jgi:hypothetical protein
MQTSPSWQDTATAIGTLLAVAVALGIALAGGVSAIRTRRRTERLQKIATASLVSGWVEDTYVPTLDGRAYVRRAIVHLANESNEPVFNVYVSIGVGWHPRSIGPLSVPASIPVLPPRRSFSWDISVPLRAHENTYSPRAETSFMDSSGCRWVRGLDGSLREVTDEPAQLVSADSEVDRANAEVQQGRMDAYNPMAAAISFVNILSYDTSVDLEQLRQVLDPEAAGWKSLDAAQANTLREEFADYGLAGFVSYPAPQVAYVKLAPVELAGHQVVNGPVPISDARIITLTFTHEHGWRVFSYGAAPTEPDRIQFPNGAIRES